MRLSSDQPSDKPLAGSEDEAGSGVMPTMRIKAASFTIEPEDARTLQNYKALLERSFEVFGDRLVASRWLSMPSADLDGAVPLHIAQRVNYAADELERIFEPVFVRMEHGIYL